MHRFLPSNISCLHYTLVGQYLLVNRAEHWNKHKRLRVRGHRLSKHGKQVYLDVLRENKRSRERVELAVSCLHNGELMMDDFDIELSSKHQLGHKISQASWAKQYFFRCSQIRYFDKNGLNMVYILQRNTNESFFMDIYTFHYYFPYKSLFFTIFPSIFSV